MNKNKPAKSQGKMEIKGKPVFCGEDGKWKDELEKRLPTDDEIVALALGDVKYDVLRYLNNRKGPRNTQA